MPIIEAIENIAAPSIENPLADKTLSDAIAASDKPKSTRRSAKSKEGLNTKQAFELAQSRGYTGNAKTFRDRFDKSGYGEQFGLKRIPHKQGRENWLYFDAKTQS